MSNNPNAPVGLRLKQRSVLSFNTPGGMSRAMSQMRVLGTPGGPPGSQSQLSQDPGAPSQPVGSGDGMQSQGMGMMSQGMGMMSQGMPMYTPDFITPVDAQFACNYDPNEKENKGPRSPVHLSPMRSKRPRFGFDPSQLSQDSQLGSQPAGMGLGSQPANWGGSSQGLPENGGAAAGARGENSGGGEDAVFRVPAPRAPSGGRAPLPRAAQSPPCLRNPFLGERDQPEETPAHARANGASAAALATMSRLRADFVDLGVLGRGGFCKVFKVISRLDGSQYAVKRTERKLQSERERREALREVQAMASLGGGADRGGEHVVRYFGCWMEYDHLYIQLELCDTTLSAAFAACVESRARESMDAETSAGGAKRFGQKEIEKVLRHVASALAFAHARNVAHLDVKPDNVLVRDGVYKLADWGRAAPVDGVGYVGDSLKERPKSPKPVSVEEGDSRYLAPELLRGEFAPYEARSAEENETPGPHATGDGQKRSPYSFVGLDRADVFSLGATAYELASGAPLPASGEAYQALRNGRVSFASFAASPGKTENGRRFSDGSRRETDARDGCFTTVFQTLVSSMVAADPGARPCAAEVLAVLDKMDANERGPGEDGVGGSQGVIGMFSPAVPDSTAKPSPGSSRPGLGGTPSRLGFGAGPMGGR
jgi:wee1-like protein kinase